MAFDVDGARKAGYSDDEIAGFLSEQSGFDLAGARAAGYAPADVIGFLSTAAKPEPADKLNLGDPMGTGGSEIMAAAAPPSAGIVEQVARPNMLQQGFVDTVRNEVIGSLPAEKRLPALKELARAPGAYGIAAREILGDVEQENAYYVGKEANERQARKINASTPVPAAGRPRMAEGGRAAIVDATPGFADMARGDDEAAVAKTKTTAGILSAAQEGARKERQTTEARLQQPRTAEEWISDSGVYGKQGWALLRQVIANSVDPSSEWSAAINAEMKGLDAELTEKERFRREEVAKHVSGTDSEIRRFAIVLSEMANPTIGAQEIIKQLPLMASIIGLTVAGGLTGGLVVRGASAALPTVALADAIGGGGITAAGKLAGGLIASRTGAAVAAGGDAAQGVYEELTSAKSRPLMLQNPDVLKRIGQGMSEDDAIKAVALTRARIAQGLAGAVGAALGGTGLEGQVARKVAGKATGDGAAKAFAKELGFELADELSTQGATNWQIGQVDPSRKLTEGSGETAASTLVTTLPMASTSAVMGHQEAKANPLDQMIAANRLSVRGLEYGAADAGEFFRSDADVGPAPRPQGARPAVDTVAAIQAAPTVDDAIRTAAQAVDQTIDETQNAGAAAAVDNIARILGTESTNVGSPAAVPGVAAPAGGAGAVDAAAGVGAGVGTAGVVRPAVDAGSVGGQASGDAVPLGAGQPGALSFAPRSAGPVQQITVTPAGTVTAVGDPQALMRLLKAAGVTSVIPSKDGITVGKSQAEMARKILDDFVAAPPASPPVVGAKAQADGDVVLQNRNRSTPSSIAQMRSIAAAPDYGRLGFSRDFANGAPVISGGKIPDAQVGRSDVAVASDGRRIPVRYAVVEADSVLASNSADGLANPDYGRQDLDVPRAIAGNGRIAGLQAAHANGQASAYVAELAQDNLHGIDPEVIRGMRSPVLVRVMPKEAITADIGDVSNTTGNLDLSAVESARNDAARINLEALQFSEDGALTPEAVRQFVRAMPQAEQGALVDTNGQPTRQAVDRLNAAVFFKAYGNDELVRLYAQAQDPEARLIMSALAQVAPAMARLEGAGDLDVRPVLTDAAKIAVNARRDGVSIKVAAKQLDLDADPGVSVFLDLFAANSRSVRPVVEALARVADFAYTEASKPAEDMFGDVPRASRSDVLNQIKGQPDEASNDQQAKRVADAPGRDGAPAADSGQGADARAAQGSAARGEGQARGQEGERVGGEGLDSRQVRGSGAANPAPQAGRAPGNAGAAAGDSGNRRGNPEGARNDRPQDLLGEAPNASQQEEARLRAEREAQQRRQQQQAPDAADFQMSGSDRAVDVGAAAGQRDLLAGAPDAGLSAADTQTVVATFRANGLDIKVADTQDDLPESAQRRMLSEGISGVRGLYDPATDTTWIVRSNLGSKEEAFFVGLHEAFHRGLVRTFGRDINAILGYIELNNKSVRDKAREYRDTYKMGRYEAIEEVLADMAGEGKASDLRGWDRLLAFLRQVIQSMARGIGVNIPVTDAMVEQLVAGIRKEGMRDTPAFVVQSNKGPMFLRVFHGTPHEVDRFSTDKIGTGEGAHAYGWGLYFASRREVAEHYRKKLEDQQYYYNGEPIDETNPLQVAAATLDYNDGDKAAAIAELRSGALTSYSDDRSKAVWRAAADLLESGARLPVVKRTKGNLYEVNIPEDGEYLLWDKPLSEQPEGVSKALTSDTATMAALEEDQFGGPVMDQVTGRDFYRALSRRLGGDRQASEYLRSLGIRGIKYLDGVSRNKSLRDVKREFLAELPEDADFDEVMDLIGEGTFSPANEAILKALQENDWLGFDYPAQAISAALGGKLADFDASPALVKAVADAQEGGTFNYVIFDDADVEIAARFSRQSDQTDARMSELADRTPSETGLDTEPDRALEPWRVDLAPALSTAMRRWEAGRATDADLAAAVRAELDNRKAKREEATDRDRVRGADWLQERILRARRTGEMSTAEADLALWLLNRAPQVATDLGISIKSGDMTKPNGTYNVLERVVTSFTSKSNPDTLTHEILHHTERMMPEPVQNAIRKEWLKQLEAEGKKARTGLEQRIAQAEADPRLKQAVGADKQRIVLLDWMLEAARKGDADLASSLYGGFRDGISLKQVLPYELSSPSEFWAVNAASLVRKRAETGTSLWRQARQWMVELVQKAKSLLGLRSNAPVIRGLEAVLAGDGSFVSRGMISTGARELNDQTNTPAFRAWFAGSKVVRNDLADMLAEPDGARVLIDDLLAAQGTSGASLDPVQALMLALSQNDKIGRAVVGLVPVDVVNSLAKNGVRPKDGGGNRAVFIDALNSPVSDKVLSTFRGVLTNLSAKLSDAITTGRDQELAPALRASDFNLREVGGLLSLQGRTNLGGGNGGIVSVGADQAAKTSAAGGGSPTVNAKLGAAEFADLLNKFMLLAPHAKDSISDDLPSAENIAQQGKPLVVYHGTASDFDAFQMDAPLRNKVRVLATWAASKIDGSYSTRRAKEKATAFFTSDPALASDYAASFGDAAAQVVMPTYLSLQRPVVMDFTTGVLTKPDGSTFDIGRIADAAVFSNEALIDIARQSRADGVVMRGVRDDAPNGAKRGSGDVFIVFRPEQIKSAIGNRGTFDPANPDIRFSRGGDNLKATERVASLIADFRAEFPGTPPSGMAREQWRDWNDRRHAAQKKLEQEVAAIAMQADNALVLPLRYNAKTLVALHPDTKKAGGLRTTYFVAETFEPTGHEEYNRPEEAAAAWVNMVDPNGERPMFARATANPTQAGTPAALTPQTSPWRDETGRLQFLPGAWLYEKFGPEVGGAVMGGATGAAAGPVGAVVGAVAGAASARLMLNRLELKAASPALRRALREMKIQVAKAQETAAAVATEAMKLTEAERGMVSDLIEQEMAAGTVPPQHAVRLAAMINTTMGAQTDELVRLGMLSSESADMWRGKYLPRFYESKLRNSETMGAWADALRQLTGRPKTMAGIKGKHLRGRGMYETIPEAELPQWEQMGWEVRDPDYQPGLTEDGTVQVWRDFTRQERDSMGEIRDAGFRFVMGYMQTQRDIALGRMFEALAADPAMSSRRETEEFSVMVPDSTVPGTGAKRYGKLAGRWVSKDTLSHLSAIEEAQSEVWRMYRKALATWKEGKTSMNPVSHVNNVVSNLTMAHLAGVSYLRADKYIGAARDFATNAPGIQEAKDAGLFLGTMSDAELMQVLPEDLKALVRKQDSTATKVGRSAFNVMTFFLRRPMGWAYQAEDTFFRYLIYKDARERGLEPADAVDYAQKYIFTYDDLPKGARMIRDFGIPFFSYTFKAVPALLHTAMTHPLRMAMPAALLWAANAAAYAIAFGGDDDDSWEESLKKYLTDGDFRNKVRQKEKLEREHLPPWMKGTTALLTPKTVRLGMDEVTKLPVFIDVSRIIPGGDLFDVSPNAGGIPLPQPVTPSHPLFTTAVAMLGNKDLFFGKELVDANDTRGEATLKRMDWMWKQMTPAIALGNYHFERGMNALAQATGEEIRWMPEAIAPDAVVTGIGRDGLPVQPRYAAMQTFGIKARPIDLEMAEDIGEGQKNKMLREIDAEIRRLQRLNMKGAVADSVMNRKRDQAQVKKDRIRDNLTVDGEERP